MSMTNGHQAIISRIVTMSGAPNVVLPNGPGKDCPRFVVQEAGGSQRTATVAGETDAYPEVIVRVETDTAYATENNALVAALVARFAPGSRFDGVTILDAPLPRAPLPVTEGVYSVPVIIRGRISF